MIFSFSLKDAEESSQQSDWVADKLSEIVEAVEETVNTKINIRKVAHFCEYALLGAETSFLCFLTENNKKKKWLFFLVFGIVIASLDEAIQNFAPGRDSAVKDVFIDMSGYISGLLFTLCIYLAVLKIKEKNMLDAYKTEKDKK